MLTHRAKEKVDAHVASILDLTVKALNDPSVDVRNMGKEAFTHITNLFPTEALRMLMRVSATMRSQRTSAAAVAIPVGPQPEPDPLRRGEAAFYGGHARVHQPHAA